MKTIASAIILLSATILGAQVPVEPVPIGHEPQFFIDDWIVDNRWALKPKKPEEVVRVFHTPARHPANPVIANDGGYCTVVRDADTGRFKMWWQTHETVEKGGEESADYAIAYAESEDGLKWNQPKLGLISWKGTRDNNIVWRGITGKRASGAQILTVPEKDRRGYRYIMTYRTSGAREASGIRVVGSADGIHWDNDKDTQLVHLHSDTLNSIVYDTQRSEYVMTCRPKDRYLTFKGEMIDTGESRRIARLSHSALWEAWPENKQPQTVLIPDELDLAHGFNRFYGMPNKYHAGIHWGMLWGFKLNSDIHTELAWSRDSFHFHRVPSRQRLIDLGPEGAWDDGMVFGSADWVEMGDEWWIYYGGHDGPHEARDRKAGIGLVTLRKEGFASLRGPAGGGVVCTRLLTWPGGELVINANAGQGGEVKVRVSDAFRKPVQGYGFDEGKAFTGDSIEHVFAWKGGHTLAALAGTQLHLEFYLRDADLFSFRAGP